MSVNDDANDDVIDLNSGEGAEDGATAPEVVDRGDSLDSGEPSLDALKAIIKDEPKADEKVDDKAEARIPKSRFDEVNERMKASEAREATLAEELAKLKQPTAPAKVAAPAPAADETTDIDAKEEAYIQAMFNGDTKAAATIRREINTEIRRQAAHDAETNITAQLSKRELATSINAVVAESVSKYPFLDSDAEVANEQAISDVVEWRDFYASKGHPLNVALQMAVAKIGPLFAKSEPAAPESKQESNVRQIEAVRRNAQAANAQPAQLDGVGERASKAGRVNVEAMTDEEFEALPAAERRRLRGDA